MESRATTRPPSRLDSRLRRSFLISLLLIQFTSRMASIKVPDLILSPPPTLSLSLSLDAACHLASWYLSLPCRPLEYLDSPSFPTARADRVSPSSSFLSLSLSLSYDLYSSCLSFFLLALSSSLPSTLVLSLSSSYLAEIKSFDSLPRVEWP